MHVVSDEERRRVAERLRSVAREVDRGGFSETIKHVKLAVFEDLDRYRPNGTLDRLADLIEPSCDREAERTCRDTDCDTESITCSECGEITRYTLFWVDVDGGKTVKGHRPRFCSNCGRRVLYDSNDYI